MKRVRRFIHEIHRRSLWQVLAIYLAGSWAVIQSTDAIVGLLGLPEWAPRLALFLLIIGLPIVLATAFVQEGAPAPTVSSGQAAPALQQRPGARGMLTWRNAVIGGISAFALWGVVAAGWMMAARMRGPVDDDLLRIAVLPFDNEGAAEDEYFADGVADEVRVKLASIPGLQVTARGSTSQYKENKEKPPKQIGKELEVEYLLTGTVRWAKSGAANRVRVSPELIKVADESTVWTEAFEKELSDVFGVQTDIASTVAAKLNVALGTQTQQRLAERPTGNIDAWDAYLKGEQITQGLANMDLGVLRKALPFYERAVTLDSTFAEAWGRIARAECEFNRITVTAEGMQRAKRAAERALAAAPNRAAGHLGMSCYLRLLQHDYASAAEQARLGLALEPNNSELLGTIAASLNSLGQFDSALVHLQRARDINPRSVLTLRQLASGYSYVGRYQDAIKTLNHAIELAPTNVGLYQVRSLHWAALGELDSVRASAKQALARGVDTTSLVARYALIQESMWMLPPELLPRVVKLPPEAFDNNRVQWGLKVGATWKLLGDAARAKAYADSAVSAVDAMLRRFPDDAQLHELRGRALALAGRRTEAVHEAEQSLHMRETSLDAISGPYYRFQVVRILLQAGEVERALDELGPLIDKPSLGVTRAYLRLDPGFKPLRGNPRFERMIAPTT